MQESEYAECDKLWYLCVVMLLYEAKSAPLGSICSTIALKTNYYIYCIPTIHTSYNVMMKKVLFLFLSLALWFVGMRLQIGRAHV